MGRRGTHICRCKGVISLINKQEASGQDEGDDFEIVPQDQDDDDAEMWDAEGENEDEIKQAKIKSE